MAKAKTPLDHYLLRAIRKDAKGDPDAIQAYALKYNVTSLKLSRMLRRNRWASFFRSFGWVLAMVVTLGLAMVVR